MTGVQVAIDAPHLVLGALVVQVAVHALLGEPGAEKIGVAADASAVVSESAGLVQRLHGLPVDLGEVLKELAVNVLATQTGFLGVIVQSSAGKVAIDAMDYHPALVGEVR